MICGALGLLGKVLWYRLGAGRAAYKIRDFTFWMACRGTWLLSMVDFGVFWLATEKEGWLHARCEGEDLPVKIDIQDEARDLFRVYYGGSRGSTFISRLRLTWRRLLELYLYLIFTSTYGYNTSRAGPNSTVHMSDHAMYIPF